MKPIAFLPLIFCVAVAGCSKPSHKMRQAEQSVQTAAQKVENEARSAFSSAAKPGTTVAKTEKPSAAIQARPRRRR